MTRSLTIVNSSNWEHEDYEFSIPMNNPTAGPVIYKTVRLKPGEYISYSPYTQTFIVTGEEKQDKAPVPFYVNGEGQVIPIVRVGFSGGKEISLYK